MTVLTYLSIFFERTEHHNAGAAMLPHHSPEVSHRAAHGTLGNDVLMPPVVTLTTTRTQTYTGKKNHMTVMCYSSNTIGTDNY